MPPDRWDLVLAIVVVTSLITTSVVIPGRPTYQVRVEYSPRTDTDEYWVYRGSWPFGMRYELEAGFSSREDASRYVERARSLRALSGPRVVEQR